jgi:hypothetical protein
MVKPCRHATALNALLIVETERRRLSLGRGSKLYPGVAPGKAACPPKHRFALIRRCGYRMREFAKKANKALAFAI